MEIKPNILIVDDEVDFCELLFYLLKKEGFDIRIANDGATAMKLINTITPDVMVLDIKIPGIDGIEVLKRTKTIDPNLPIIMITGYANINEAVLTMKEGAYNYISKPFDNKVLIGIIRNALKDTRREELKSKELTEDTPNNIDLKEMMGQSDIICQLDKKIKCVAKSNYSVVILGETGTGKEIVAHSIHQNSLLPNGPFLPVNCGSITETLCESELFGYEKGAFTDAKQQTCGKIESAQGGTLFLDEISNMPIASQAILLRVLQDKEIFRVGGTKPLHIDFRIIAASNQNFDNAIKSGLFRQDLFFRLNEFTINIPPLRERKEDILYLAKRFLYATNTELNKNVKGFTELALENLLSYDWPGNVRQLKSTIRRAMLLADEIIESEHLDIVKQPAMDLEFSFDIDEIVYDGSSLKTIVKKATIITEQKLLGQIIKFTKGNKALAARILKVDYKTIHTKLKKFGIS